MKINTKHLVIPALMAAVGAGLVGSITGTVAWYQYSTRATASIVGSSVECSEGLQMKVGNSAWGNEFKTATIQAQANENANGTKFQPVTSATKQETAFESTSDGELTLGNFRGHPTYQDFDYASEWQKAPKDAFLQFDLYFRVLAVDGSEAGQEKYLAKKVYFETFDIQAKSKKDNTTSLDAAKAAMRFHFANVTANEAPKYTLLSQSASTTYLGSKLDLNNDNKFDEEKVFEYEKAEPTAQVYGNASLKQTTVAYSDFVGSKDANNRFVGGSKALGTTKGGTHLVGDTVTAGNELHFVVTIWLEGWDGNSLATGYSAAASSLWDAADYLGSMNIGMRFGITPYGQQ